MYGVAILVMLIWPYFEMTYVINLAMTEAKKANIISNIIYNVMYRSNDIYVLLIMKIMINNENINDNNWKYNNENENIV